MAKIGLITGKDVLEGNPDRKACYALKEFFEKNKEQVFYGRQIEVIHENVFYHWVTNRALRTLAERKVILFERRSIEGGREIVIYWHPSFRYYRRSALRLVALVEEYSRDIVGSTIGRYGELLVLEGFATNGFQILAKNANSFRNEVWLESGHNLDLIICKDNINYGVEIKNTLSYLDRDELEAKIAICRHLNLVPIFVCRMLPKTYIDQIIQVGGFALILKFLLYPEILESLAKRMVEELGLFVGTPSALSDGTIKRFTNWHDKHVK